MKTRKKLTGREILNKVYAICHNSISNTECPLSISEFNDTYKTKEGHIRRMKVSGLYVNGTELKTINEALRGTVVKGREYNWKFIGAYRRVNSLLYNSRWWRNDSSVLCLKFKEV